VGRLLITAVSGRDFPVCKASHHGRVVVLLINLLSISRMPMSIQDPVLNHGSSRSAGPSSSSRAAKRIGPPPGHLSAVSNFAFRRRCCCSCRGGHPRPASCRAVDPLQTVQADPTPPKPPASPVGQGLTCSGTDKLGRDVLSRLFSAPGSRSRVAWLVTHHHAPSHCTGHRGWLSRWFCRQPS